MSRKPVTRKRLIAFLKELGKRFHGRARLYLVGGTTVVYEKLRAETIDIDIAIEADGKSTGELISSVSKLKDEMDINVEEANPGHFIPLPSGYESRHTFVGKFGGINVYNFDPYSAALSKIDRGTEADFADVAAMLKGKIIEFGKLESCFEDVRRRFGKESLKQDPKRLEDNFKILRTLIRK